MAALARLSGNRFVGVNYLDDNPRMAVPPEYWLQRLYDFDADLMVFPSRHIPYAYVLARRARLSTGLGDLALADIVDQPDTRLCLQRQLVPVSMIYRTGEAWSIDNIIASLKARDVWAMGGSAKVADILDENDAARERKTRANIRDDMWNRSGDAWRSYQARTGQRTRPTLGQVAQPASEHRPERSSGSTAAAA